MGLALLHGEVMPGAHFTPNVLNDILSYPCSEVVKLLCREGNGVGLAARRGHAWGPLHPQLPQVPPWAALQARGPQWQPCCLQVSEGLPGGALQVWVCLNTLYVLAMHETLAKSIFVSCIVEIAFALSSV